MQAGEGAPAPTGGGRSRSRYVPGLFPLRSRFVLAVFSARGIVIL